MQIGFVIFPNLTQLDFTGPLQVLSRLPGAILHVVAKTLQPVASDSVLMLMPTTTFADCPTLDLLCIPGGFGVDQAMEDEETMAFVRGQGAGAKYVTSVCTGAFILGAAGLLRGRKATTHWAYHHLLPHVGAIPVKERVVRDGNRFTGGGVTAGIDFALTLMAEIAGPDIAQAVQLSLEYDPHPPFNAGSPRVAQQAVKEAADERFAARLGVFEAVLSRVCQDTGA
ncbi:MAG: DJ-1/PfpI family protein [Acidiferrobacterales bacterium]